MPMLAAALLAVTSLQGDLRNVDLFRGASIQGLPIRYWDVTDTYLDSLASNVTFGGEGVLLGGSGKTILIRFGDLQRIVDGGTVKSASLILTPSGGEIPQLRAVSRLLVPFGEGPVNTLASMLERNMADPKKPYAPAWSSSWSTRRAGVNYGWQSAGANGSGDIVPIDTAKFTNGEETISIDGLASAVQQMADHPDENYGFALSFSNKTEFFSTNSFGGRPKLHLEIEPGTGKKAGADLSVTYIEQQNRVTNANEKFVAHVKNVGDAPATAVAAKWMNAEKPGANAPAPAQLAPGEEITLTYERPYSPNPKDHRTQPLGLVVQAGNDVNSSNNSLTVAGDGKLIKVAASPGIEDALQAQVRFFNETLAPQSRFSFAREGALERVAITSISADETGADLVWKKPLGVSADPEFQKALMKAVGLPDLAVTANVGSKDALADRGSLDAYPGIGGYGDTRFDGTILGTLTMLYEPFSNGALDIQPLEPTDLLSATDAAILNKTIDGSVTLDQVLNQGTSTVILRALDIMGRALPNMELSFFQAKDGAVADQPPTMTVVTDDKGIIKLNNQGTAGPFGKISDNGGNGVFLVRASNNGVTEWSWLKFWQLVDTYSRSGTGAAIFDMRFNLPGAPLDASTDLAKDKIVSDKAGSTPAKLSALVDGEPSTMVELGQAKDDWIEIDLGRDRTIGEIDVIAGASDMWPKFDIVAYSTGQNASSGTTWAKEVKWDWTAVNRRTLVNNANAVAYRGPGNATYRYIRLINRSTVGGKIGGIRVIPAKQ